MSGDEHPSGLRDAIAGPILFRELGLPPGMDTSELRAAIEASVGAWLSVVSEGELEEVALSLSEELRHRGYPVPLVDLRFVAASALAASRGVLFPKET